MRFLRRKRLAAVVAAVAALGVAGVAYAQIPDSAGVIHSCYLKSGGALRVIDSSVTKCKSTETSLNWNQKGATGPKGATGASGASGPTGPTGPAGVSLFANVAADGTLINGSGALSVNKTATPRYEVTFDRDISMCAGSAVVGGTGTPTTVASGAAGIVQTGLIGNDVARTSFNDGGTFESTDFKLIIVC